MAEEKMAANVPADANEEGGRVFVVESNRRDDLIKTVLLVVLIVIFPPAAVAVHANECNKHVFISLILVFFFFILAYIHAIWYCFFRKSAQMIIATVTRHVTYIADIFWERVQMAQASATEVAPAPAPATLPPTAPEPMGSCSVHSVCYPISVQKKMAEARMTLCPWEYYLEVPAFFRHDPWTALQEARFTPEEELLTAGKDKKNKRKKRSNKKTRDGETLTAEAMTLEEQKTPIVSKRKQVVAKDQKTKDSKRGPAPKGESVRKDH